MRTRQASNLGFCLFAAQHRMASLMAAEIDRDIGSDPVEPGREARTRFEPWQILEGADEGLLCQFKCIILIMDYC